MRISFLFLFSLFLLPISVHLWNIFYGGFFLEREKEEKGRFGGWLEEAAADDRSVHICLFAFNLAKEERSDSLLSISLLIFLEIGSSLLFDI